MQKRFIGELLIEECDAPKKESILIMKFTDDPVFVPELCFIVTADESETPLHYFSCLI